MIRYAYLWGSEYLRGLEEGLKDRPCAIVLAAPDGEDGETVVVLPITHSPPRDPDDALEIPVSTKKRLNLDFERSWIVLAEANRFTWPGPDLRPAKKGDAASVVYGALPRAFFDHVKARFVARARARKTKLIPRGQ